jgi:hypothetical protein
MTGILISGKISVGVLRAASGPKMRISKDITKKV